MALHCSGKPVLGRQHPGQRDRHNKRHHSTSRKRHSPLRLQLPRRDFGLVLGPPERRTPRDERNLSKPTDGLQDGFNQHVEQHVKPSRLRLAGLGNNRNHCCSSGCRICICICSTQRKAPDDSAHTTIPASATTVMRARSLSLSRQLSDNGHHSFRKFDRSIRSKNFFFDDAFVTI